MDRLAVPQHQTAAPVWLWVLYYDERWQRQHLQAHQVGGSAAQAPAKSGGRSGRSTPVLQVDASGLAKQGLEFNGPGDATVVVNAQPGHKASIELGVGTDSWMIDNGARPLGLGRAVLARWAD